MFDGCAGSVNGLALEQTNTLIFGEIGASSSSVLRDTLALLAPTAVLPHQLRWVFCSAAVDTAYVTILVMKYIHVKSLSGISALTLAISVIIPPVVLLFIALTLTALYGVSKRRGVDKLLMYKWVILYAYFLLIIVWLISLGDGAGLVMAFGGYMLVVGTFVPLGAYCLTELFRYNAMDQKVNTKK